MESKNLKAGGAAVGLMTRGVVILGLAIWAAGCATERIPGEQAIGSSARAAFALQVVNPHAAQNAPAPSGLHGAAAKASIDRFIRSFEVPAPPANLFTIGMGAPASTASPAAANAGSGAAGSAPRP